MTEMCSDQENRWPRARSPRRLIQMINYEWRGAFTNAELNALHAEGFGHKVLDDDWVTQVSDHSLGWVCARDDADQSLAGFVNVPWDGAIHAFILDTLVTG